MNPYDERQRNNLFKSIESSYKNLRPFRDLNRALVKEYAGPLYGDESEGRKEKLINLMNQTVDAYTMVLVANRPRVMISTKHQELGYFGRQFQLAVNNLIEEIGLEYTLKRWVLDAFFCAGFVKLHMADAGQVMIAENIWMDPGKPFCSNVSLDNWVHDCSATNWYEMKFAGDSYRIPFEDLKSDIYDQNVVKDMMPTTKYDVDSDRLERITKGYETDPDEFEPHVDLCDIWIARDNKVYTYAINRATDFRCKGAPVAVMDWNGPEFGQYKMLGFNDVPENIMPTSPASHLSCLDRLVNNIARKNAKQARNQKENITYTPAGAGGAKKLHRANDGDMIEVEDVKEIGLIRSNGADQGNQAFLLGAIEMFDRMAGNLTAMMGLGAQADTASQEQLIHAASSKKEAQMQFRVIDGSRRIIRDLGHMLWNDKFKTMRGSMPVPGADTYSIDMTWTPQDREGDFLDYNFEIDLYSMPYQSPAQKVQAAVQIMTQLFMPMLPMGQQQGQVIDMQAMTNDLSEMLNLPELKRWVKFTGVAPEQEPGPQGMEGMPKPSTSTRNYVRRSVPSGGTQQSRSHVMQAALLGGGVNQQQMATLSRPAA